MSFATQVGVGFPGVSRIEAVDTVNGFVRVLLKPWAVNQPGIDPDSDVINSVDKTYSNAEFDALGLKMSRARVTLRQETYDAQQGIWTYTGEDHAQSE